MLGKHLNEITIIYNNENSIDKEVLAYIQGSSVKIREVNTLNQKLTGTLYEEISQKINISSLKELVNHETEEFEKIKNMSFDSDTDYIKIFQHTPQLLKNPILVHQNHASFAKGAGDIAKFLE